MVSILVEPTVRDGLIAFLADHGVETRPFFYPAHVLPPYLTSGTYPVAERLSASGINLPSYPELTETEIATVCDLVARHLDSAG